MALFLFDPVFLCVRSQDYFKFSVQDTLVLVLATLSVSAVQSATKHVAGVMSARAASEKQRLNHRLRALARDTAVTRVRVRYLIVY